MRPFGYARAPDLESALTALVEPGTEIIAGGTELVNWLKEGIAAPDRLLDITALPLDAVETTGDGLQLGGLARMSDVAGHPAVVRDYPVLAESLLSAASAQLRTMATIGGNLMQRTRCPYFRAETLLPCNQRDPGSGCAALHGDTSSHAIFGWTPECVATHPSDLTVALAALDAEVILRDAGGTRAVPMADFYRQPGAPRQRPTTVEPEELITAIRVPAAPSAHRSHYLKVRERVSYEFAVVSAAAVVELDGPTITGARLALGGVAHRPWRLPDAEAALVGVPISDATAVREAVARSFTSARPLPGNGFKVELAQRAAVRALRTAGGVA